MELITSVILDYLNSANTLGAIQIDGPWGCGKTFYVKNVLLPQIEENEIQQEEKFKSQGQIYEKRVPLMVSLFGIKSVDDIAKQLLFASTHSRYGLSEKRIEGIKKAFSNIAKCVPYLKELDWDKVLEVPSSSCLKLLNEASIIILEMVEKRVASMNNAKDVETLSRMIYYRFGDNPNIPWSEEISFISAIQNGLEALSEEDKTLSAHFKRIYLIPTIKKIFRTA